jgi:SAM-dependent methyltransferase
MESIEPSSELLVRSAAAADTLTFPERASGEAAAGRATERPAPSEALELISCPSCDSKQSRLVLHGRDRLFGKPGWYRIVQCQLCDLRYLNPRPTEESLRHHYPNDYLPIRRPEATPPLLRFLTRMAVQARWSTYLDMVERVIGRIAPSARVVDVGCGLNELLVRLRELRGCSGIGVDINPEVASYIRDTLRMPVAHCTLRQARMETGSCDLVTMNEYLEHDPEPRASVTEARRITKTGGHLVVEVPLASGLPARLFGSCWSQLDVPRHLVFYTPGTLGDLLQRCGYRVLYVKPFGAPFSIGISVLQALGFTKLGRLSAMDAFLIALTGAPLLPLFPLLHEFMLVVARAE